MERKLLQTIGHPATYEDLLNEVNQSSFKQTILDTALPVKFNTSTFSKFDGSADPYEHICQCQQVMIETTLR